MTNNNNLISPITNLLTNFLFMEDLFKEADSDQAIRMVEAVLHSASPNEIAIALENRYQSWTEGDQEAFKEVVAKCNQLWGVELTFTEKAKIAEDWVKENGLSNLACVTMDNMIEEVAMNGDAEDVLYEVMRHNERHFKQFITCRYDFDDIICWFNETMVDYITDNYSLRDLAKHFDSFELMDEAVRTIEPEALIHHMRERDVEPSYATVPDALEHDMDMVIKALAEHFEKPEVFEQYGEKLFKEVLEKQEGFVGFAIEHANGRIDEMHRSIEQELSAIQDGIEMSLDLHMYFYALRTIRKLMQQNMDFESAVKIIKITSEDFDFVTSSDVGIANVAKFWELIRKDV